MGHVNVGGAVLARAVLRVQVLRGGGATVGVLATTTTQARSPGSGELGLIAGALRWLSELAQLAEAERRRRNGGGWV